MPIESLITSRTDPNAGVYFRRDVLLFDAKLPTDVAVGDLIATPVTGAYGRSMGSNYNMITRPPVVFVRDGNARLVIRRETFDDLLATDLA